MRQAYKRPAQQRLIGKWHHQHYDLIRELGAGASGTVYLAHSLQMNRLVAVKMSKDHRAISLEVNVLKRLSQVQGENLGPLLFDVDDCYIGGVLTHFYVMEYIKGEPLLDFLAKRGEEWVTLFVIQLLTQLQKLHEEGWVFGDLKPENIIITADPPRARLIDVGGVTIKNRAIKEYTEFFDRGYWQLGTRKAEPSYDLFALAFIMIDCRYQRRFERPNGQSLTFLEEKINEEPFLAHYRTVLFKAIKGKYESAMEMKRDMLKAMSQKKRQNISRVIKRKRKKNELFLVDLFLVTSFFILVYLLYLFGQAM